jgi:mono/diheme cytochrome c family protein
MQSRLLSPRAGFGILILTALASAGCEEDLGKCDELAARKPVIRADDQVMYAGQSIVVQTCATGCHMSTATGSARIGAPAGLDFDIGPVASTTVAQVPVTLPDGGTVNSTRAVSDTVALSGLRARQRMVYEQRSEIWEQVQDDAMPPKGVGDGFRLIADLGKYFSLGSGSACTRGNSLGAITTSQTREQLRNWLACGAPVVETQNASLALAADAKDSSRVLVYPGTVGDQFPSLTCDGTAPSGGSDGGAADGGVADGGASDGGAGGNATFAPMYAVLAANCNICHGATADLGTFKVRLQPEATAYTTLLGADGKGGKLVTACGTTTKPYVTPGMPEQSYLLDKIGLTTGPICGGLMVTAPGLGKTNAAGAEKIRAWIAAGAPAP